MFNEKPVLYRAKNEEEIGEKFVKSLRRLSGGLKKIDFSTKMIFTAEDQCAFEKATICWICQGEFVESQKKVRDHRA